MMLIIVICFLMENKFLNLKLTTNFPTKFYPGSTSNGFSPSKSTDVFLNEDVYDFSDDYNSIEFLGRNQTKYLFLNEKPCMVRPTLFDMNPVELKYYPFTISLNDASENMCSKRNKRHKC